MEDPNMVAPAESLRITAIAASKEITKARSDNRKATARDIQECISEVMDSTKNKDGHFTPVNAATVSTLCAFSAGHPDSEVSRHNDVIDAYLKQYGYW